MTVANVGASADNVFTTSVANAASLSGHVLVSHSMSTFPQTPECDLPDPGSPRGPAQGCVGARKSVL